MSGTIKAAKPAEKPYKLFDERGLHLLVHPNGGRRWRLKYRLPRREKLLAIGVYPGVSLAKARECEWLELQRSGLTPKTFAKKLGWFEDFLLAGELA